MPDTQHPPSSSLFFRLPLELRQKIYDHLLTAREQPVVWPANQTCNDITPGLLATCSQVHEEAGSILYRKNSFKFSHPSDCNVFVRIADHVHRHDVVNLLLRINEKELRLWQTYLPSTLEKRSFSKDFPKLQTLSVSLRHSPWSLGQDLEVAMANWPVTKALKSLVMLLEGRTPPETKIYITLSIGIHESQMEYLQRNQPQHFAVKIPTVACTRATRIGTHGNMEVMMRLFTRPRPP